MTTGGHDVEDHVTPESLPISNRNAPRAFQGLRILALDYKESSEKVTAYIRAKGVRYPVLLDADGAVAKRYGVVGIPTYVVVGRDGKVAYRGNALPEEIRRDAN